jgi:hypothetical protein
MIVGDDDGGAIALQGGLTISRGCTLAPSIVPRNISSN